MRKSVIIIAAAFAVTAANMETAAAQSLRDLLNKGKEVIENENVQNVIGTVTEGLGIQLSPDDICGTWNYSGTAVRFTSDNMLAGAASTLASSEIESKLDEYLLKIGLKEGTFSYTFNPDSTFTNTFLKQKLSGTYSIVKDDNGDDILELKYGKSARLDFLTLSTLVDIGTDRTEFLFNADKLLDFMGKISSTSDNSTLKSLSSLTSQFDGLKIGFEVKKQ